MARVPSPNRKYGVKSRADRVAEEGAGERAQRRSRAARDQGNQAAVRLILIVVAAVFGIAGSGYYLTLPPSIDDSVEAFAQKWQAGDGAGLVAMGFRSVTDAQLEFEEDFARRGWDVAPPPLTELVVVPDDDRGLCVTVWTCAGGMLKVLWELDGSGQWEFEDYSMPSWEPPGMKTAFDAFQAAWNSEGVSGLQALAREPSGRFAQKMVRVFEQRGWIEARPAPSWSDFGEVREGRCLAEFRLDIGLLQARFEYWHPKSYLSSLKLPKRK